MSKIRKPLSILLSVILVLSLFTIVPFSVSAEENSVTFINKFWTPDPDNPSGTLTSYEETVQNAISLTDEVTEWSDSNYYVLDSNVTFNKTITVTDNAYLILCNDCTLKSSYGVYVKDGAHLTVYGQDGDEGRMEVSNENGAAIGGWDDKIGGTVTIKGGRFYLRGGSKDAAIGGGRAPSGFNGINIFGGKIFATGGYGAAAIGGGRKNDNSKCGPIKIYGGNVDATPGYYGAGIGGGKDMDGGVIEINGGNIYSVTQFESEGKYGAAIGGGDTGDGGQITINGGNIKATGSKCAAGIGGGDGGDSGTIVINGGTIEAIGSMLRYMDDNNNAAGIGGGNNGDAENITINGGYVAAQGANLSAGIGGGNNGDVENITINGGTVNARGGYYGAGIGGGEDGDNGNITINGGYVKAVGGTQGAGIGSGNDEDADGKIKINGGTVLAVSDKGAAIGSGDDGDLEGSIYITGGTVYARSGIYVTNYTYGDLNWLNEEYFTRLRSDEEDHYCGAAIGAGAFANQNATIYISGGDIHAFGGDIWYRDAGNEPRIGSGAAIGAGSEQDDSFNDGGEGGDVVITGGTIEAKGGDDSSTIGHGWHGSEDGDLTLPDDYSVYDCENEVYAQPNKRVELCHKKRSHILIALCKHPLDKRYFTLKESTKKTEHTRRCKLCSIAEVENHYGDPCACDYKNGIVTVTLVNTDESMDLYSVPYGSEFVFPVGKDYVTDEFVRKFQYWESYNWDQYDPGDSVAVYGDTTFTVVPKTEFYVKTADGIEHGSVRTDKTLASLFEEVLVSVEPEKEYMPDTVMVEFENIYNHSIEHVTLEPNEDGEYSFGMREAKATIHATFKRAPHEHDGILFQPCTEVAQLSGSGSWYLTEDTELPIASLDADQTLNVCLNGHKLTVTDDNFTVAQGAELNIYDDGDHGIVTGKTINVYGTFNLYGGKLTGFTNGAVRNYQNFNMYGGSITGNTSSEHGAGVYNAPSSAGFSIKGNVIIRNNTCTGDGEDVDDNVYLSDGKVIFVEDTLGENSQIGITASQPDSAANVVDNLSGNGTLDNFFSDDEAYYLIESGTGAALARYESGAQPVTYTVIWKNGDTVLETDRHVQPNTVPLYDGEEPTKAETENYTYIFTGWTNRFGTFYAKYTPLPEVTGNEIYTATFETVPKGAHIHTDANGETHTFQEWTSTTSLPDTAGNYYLTDDVVISARWNVPRGTTNLCLAGHGIRMTGDNSPLIIWQDSTLNLFDCGEYLHYITLDNNKFVSVSNSGVEDYADGSGTVKITGGYITGGNPTGSKVRGGGVDCSSKGAVFNMYGGSIIGNCSANGGGVLIGDPNADEYNYIVGGRINMYGGAICYNNGYGIAAYGGANDNNSGVNIVSGKIKGNNAGGIKMLNSRYLALNNAEITDNLQFGVWADTRKTALNLSGKVIIRDNLNEGNQRNVYLSGDYDRRISVNGALSDDSVIGVSLNPDIAVDPDYAFTTSSNTEYNDAAKFVSDDNRYHVIQKTDGQLYLSTPPAYTVTWMCGEDVLEIDENVAAGAAPEYSGETPTKDEDEAYTYEFVGWTDGEADYSADNLPAVTSDVTYTALFESHQKYDMACYVVGSFSNWQPAEAYKMTKNTESEVLEQMLLGVSLKAGDTLKCAFVYNGEILVWYPDGTDNDYKIEADGTYNIYLRPNSDGGDDWFYNCIYVEKTASAVTYILGDADGDGVVTITDVTQIQRYLVNGTTTVTEENKSVCDVDGDGVVTIMDVTLIQRYLAEMDVKYPIGEYI